MMQKFDTVRDDDQLKGVAFTFTVHLSFFIPAGQFIAVDLFLSISKWQEEVFVWNISVLC